MATTDLKDEMKQIKDMNAKFQKMQTDLLASQNQLEGIERRKVALQQEIEQKMALHNQAVEKSMAENKAKIAEMNDQRDKMKLEREDLDNQIIALRKEKQAFAKEKEDTLNIRNNANENMKRIDAFMKIVREQAQYL